MFDGGLVTAYVSSKGHDINTERWLQENENHDSCGYQASFASLSASLD